MADSHTSLKLAPEIGTRRANRAPMATKVGATDMCRCEESESAIHGPVAKSHVRGRKGVLRRGVPNQPTSQECGRLRPNPDQSRPNWTNLDCVRPELVQIRPDSAKVGRGLHKNSRPKPSRRGPISAELDPRVAPPFRCTHPRGDPSQTPGNMMAVALERRILARRTDLPER